MMDFSLEAKQRLPKQILDNLVRDVSHDGAVRMVDEWLKTSTGTSAFPRIDKAVLLQTEHLAADRSIGVPIFVFS